MIRIHGQNDTPEYQAALELRTRIHELLPEINRNGKHRIDIIVNAQCHVGENREIDLFVLGNHYPGIEVADPDNPKQRIHICNFALLIEAKDHTNERVMFKGTQVFVLYDGLWKDASTQSYKQVYSVLKYLKLRKIKRLFINNFIWLRGVPKSDLPKGPHNILGADSTWNDVMESLVIMRRHSVWEGNGKKLRLYCTSSDGVKDFPRIVNVFTEKITPSPLDRPKLEEINRHILKNQLYNQRLGKQLLIFRGRGGTGKTVRLLRLAKNLYDDEGARILILTYNLALVSDIRRLLTILGISADIATKSIQIINIHKFFRKLFKSLDILSDDRDFLAHYDEYKRESLEIMQEFSSGELEVLSEEMSYVYGWDYVLVDEAQDWPKDERDLLYTLFDYRKFILADGVDQLVRATEYVDWREGIDKETIQVVGLKQSLRLKHSLCRFVLCFARHVGLGEYELLPNTQLPGGRVILFVGEFKRRKQILFDIVRENGNSGNRLIDMLFCVPPSLVYSTNNGERCAVADYLEKNGLKYWDGTSKKIRGDTYPTDLDQIRIIQYESSRGLEGWTVVNFKFDELYDLKKREYLKNCSDQRDFFTFDEDTAALLAGRWSMIPLTRAVDTLVIQVRNFESRIGSVLKSCYEECKDFVELWHD